MKQREFLILSISVFLTIIAWIAIDVIHLSNQHVINQKIKEVDTTRYGVDEEIFKTLNNKN